MRIPGEVVSKQAAVCPRAMALWRCRVVMGFIVVKVAGSATPYRYSAITAIGQRTGPALALALA